jgi:hypothetical protein
MTTRFREALARSSAMDRKAFVMARPAKADNELSNHEVVTLAVYLLGGTAQHVETEDVAVKAHELAPGRFTWRKYKDQINLEIVRVYLSDAKKVDKGAYLVGSGNEGWALTERGLHFAQARVGDLGSADRERKGLTKRDELWLTAERGRLLAAEATAKLAAGAPDTISPQEVEAFFRVDDYVPEAARERKVTRLLDAFGDDPDLGEAVRTLASMLKRRGETTKR